MSVTRVIMQEKVRKNLGGVAESDLPSAVINPVLDRIYQYEIPNKCGGGAIRGFLEFNTAAGTDSYDLDEQAANQTPPFSFYGVRSPLVLLDGDPIWYSTDPDHFWRIYGQGATHQSMPSGVLVDGRLVYLRPVPNAVYAIRLFVSRSRAVFGASLPDDLEAEVLIRGASMYIAADLGMGNSRVLNEGLYNLHMAQLVGGKYLSDAPGETYDRGF